MNKSDVARYDRMLNFSDEQSKFINYYLSLLLENCARNRLKNKCCNQDLEERIDVKHIIYKKKVGIGLFLFVAVYGDIIS